jgi:hypothetical protein
MDEDLRGAWILERYAVMEAPSSSRLPISASVNWQAT